MLEIPPAASADQIIACLGASQYGVVGSAQLAEHDISKRIIRRKVEKGQLSRLYPGAFLVGGAPCTWEARLLGAQLSLGPRSAVSHRSNAAFLGLEGYKQNSLELTLAGELRRRLDGVRIHRSRILTPSDVLRSGPLVLTRPERLMLELAAVMSPRMLEVAFDSLLFKGLTTFERIADYLEATRASGLNGVSALNSLLDSRDPSQAPAESFFETDFYRMLRESEWWDAEFQYEVFDEDGFIGRLDVAYPNRKVGIEAQSKRWHSPGERVDRDSLRHSRLMAAGWRILYETYDTLRHSPDQILRRLTKLMVA